MWGGVIQSTERLNRTKRDRASLLSLLELGHLCSPALGHQPSWFLRRQTWTGTYTMGSPSPCAFGLGLNYTTGFQVLQFADSRSWDFLASITT